MVEGSNVNFGYRPCMANGKKALFHQLVSDDMCITKNGKITHQIRGTFAIIEREDGTVERIDPTNVKFLDSENQFIKDEIMFRQFDREGKTT